MARLNDAQRLEAARQLLEAQRTRMPAARLSDTYPEMDSEDAYAIQSAAVAKRIADGAVVRGYKIGLTSKAMQDAAGISEPDYGHLFDDMLLADGAQISAAAYLAAGNTVVIKPPEWAPLTCSMLADVAEAAGLPAGVVNVVQGIGSDTGARLVSDPRIARVSFTGSVRTAKFIAQAAGANLVPASFELGGKSAFVVLDDADLDLAAATAALQYRNAGQVCLAGTRLLVHSRVVDEFLLRMEAVVEELRVDRARADGVRILWGGDKHPAGELFYRPTLVTDVREDSEIVQSEVFGPVLTLQTFDTDDEAVRLANSTRYGLAGIVFGEPERALAVGRRMRSGMVWINAFFLRDLEAPFGGIGDSGIGREGGHWSFDFFCDLKDVMQPRQPYAPVFAGR
ncbi:MAG: aldehyde dehydrogenase family protein [Burkholderiaceae bacterium]